MKDTAFNDLIRSTHNAINADLSVEASHATRMHGLEAKMKKNVVRIQEATVRGNLTMPDHSQTIEDDLARIRAELGLA